MKKYTSRATKWLAIFTIVSVAVLIAGIIFILARSSNVGLQIGLTMLGGLMSILFLSCFFAEKSRYLIIDDEKIIFPRGADKNGKMVFQKTTVKLCDINSVDTKLHKGDGIISKDTSFHTINLKDGTKITVTLYAYGKESENEILETIKRKKV
jgi:hypothetical protein